MPSELTTINVPFRLRDSNGAFVLDTLLANYSILILKAGAPFVPTAPAISIVTAGLGGLGRHLLTFGGGTEDEYVVFLDYTGAAANEASIEGAWSFIEKFRTSQLAGAVWDELLATHTTAGSAAEILKRILQLAQPDVVIDPIGNTVTVKDKDTGDVLLTYAVTGVMDTRVTDMDA